MLKRVTWIIALATFGFATAAHAEGSKDEGPKGACEGVSFPTDDEDCLIELAQDGGFVLYTRHVRTETDFADQDDPTTNLDNCNLQRVVSDEGWDQAVVLREAIEDNDIPIRGVTSSQFCRAWQTAVQMYGRLSRKTADLNFITEEECADEPDLGACLDRKAVENLSPLLSRKVRKGKNRALVAHDDPFKSISGYYPFPMGATYLVKPLGRKKGFEVL
ncbi:MAG: hypothetical protein AAGC67_06040, partial [Myxococcota bacterium]